MRDVAVPVVLALRALGLGDGLAGVAALRGLRRAFGGHRLVLAAPDGIGAFLRRRGIVDEVLPTCELGALTPRLWAESFDRPPEVAVDLHGCGPASHRLLQALRPGRLIAWRCPAAGYLDGPVHRLDEQEVLRWCRLISYFGGDCGPGDLLLDPLDPPAGRSGPPGDGAKPRLGFADLQPPLAAGRYAVVHPGAASGSRRWPAPRFAAAAAALAHDGWHVVVTGSPGEKGLTASVTPPGGTDLAGALDLDGLAAVIAGAALTVSGDTGVAHLATAHRVRSVLLFGPTPPAWWGPAIDPDLHRVLWHGPQLIPPATPAGSGAIAAGYRGDPHGARLDPALAAITVAEVLDAIRALAGPPGLEAAGEHADQAPDLTAPDLTRARSHGVGIPPVTARVSPVT